MSISRRNVLKMGAAMAAVPLVGDLATTPGGQRVFSTGAAEIDRMVGGGLRMGSVVVVMGPRASGKSAFMLRLAKANGIMDSHLMGTGHSDMLSIVERADGAHVGSLMLDSTEPSTPQEQALMQSDSDARDAFLVRWLKRTREVVHESGGLFAISICQMLADAQGGTWLTIPDYVITVDGGEVRLQKHA